MGTTTNFVKLRSNAAPKTGEWNINYDQAVVLAKKLGKPVIAVWSNGDSCAHCVSAEKCMMTTTFKSWIKDVDAYFVFQYSGDKDKGKVVHDWIFNKDTKIKQYPGFRITSYDKSGSIIFDEAITGNKLRENKSNDAGAKNMIKNISAMLAKDPVKPEPAPKPIKQDYKVRLNEKLTTAQVNKILDAIDKNDGYCPCQPKYDGSKCHCEDFTNEKGIGEPCICKIYVKQKK